MTATGRRVAVVGAGRMGRGIALAFAYAGYDIDMLDLKVRTEEEWDRLSTDAREDMASSLAMLAELGAIPEDAVARLLGRIHLFAEGASNARLAEADVIFEGVTETLVAKKQVFARICASCRPAGEGAGEGLHLAGAARRAAADDVPAPGALLPLCPPGAGGDLRGREHRPNAPADGKIESPGVSIIYRKRG